MKCIFWLLPGLLAFAAASSAQNRPTVSLTVMQPTVTEGQGGAATLVVRRTGGAATSLRVFYRVSGSARNGVDYERVSGAVDILASSGETSIEIIPLDDTRREPTERVTVQLRPAPPGRPQYNIGARRSQTVQILDDDRPVVNPPPSPPSPIPGGRPPWFPVPGIISTISTNTTTTP